MQTLAQLVANLVTTVSEELIHTRPQGLFFAPTPHPSECRHQLSVSLRKRGTPPTAERRDAEACAVLLRVLILTNHETIMIMFCAARRVFYDALVRTRQDGWWWWWWWSKARKATSFAFVDQKRYRSLGTTSFLSRSSCGAPWMLLFFVGSLSICAPG